MRRACNHAGQCQSRNMEGGLEFRLVRPPTLVFFYSLLQNGICYPTHQYSLLHFQFSRTHLPLYLSSRAHIYLFYPSPPPPPNRSSSLLSLSPPPPPHPAVSSSNSPSRTSSRSAPVAEEQGAESGEAGLLPDRRASSGRLWHDGQAPEGGDRAGELRLRLGGAGAGRGRRAALLLPPLPRL
jgi:hypothetical protein